MYADGTGSDVASVLLLAQPMSAAEGAWQPYPMSPSGGAWVADVAAAGPMRWIVQAVDAAGNIAIETGRGRLPLAGTTAPTLTESPDAATLALGDRLVRSIVIDDATVLGRIESLSAAASGGSAAAGLAASFTITDTRIRGDVVASGPALVTTVPDGIARATVDHVVNHSGSFLVKVEVCRALSCSSTSFPLEVGPPSTAPTASVELSSDLAGTWPTATLTANAKGTDAEGDAVTFAYTWTRNGVPIDDHPDATLGLAGIAQPGDVIGVTVVPSDAHGVGHPASASAVVTAQPVPPAAPRDHGDRDDHRQARTRPARGVARSSPCTSSARPGRWSPPAPSTCR